MLAHDRNVLFLFFESISGKKILGVQSINIFEELKIFPCVFETGVVSIDFSLCVLLGAMICRVQSTIT